MRDSHHLLKQSYEYKFGYLLGLVSQENNRLAFDSILTERG